MCVCMCALYCIFCISGYWFYDVAKVCMWSMWCENRALARIGTSYYKKDDLKNALTYYNKSLSEHREADVIKKSQEVRRN